MTVDVLESLLVGHSALPTAVHLVKNTVASLVVLWVEWKDALTVAYLAYRLAVMSVEYLDS